MSDATTTQATETVAHPAIRRERGRGRLFRRGGRWWVSYYAPKNGRSVEHREPGGATEKEAQQKLKRRLDAVTTSRMTGLPFQGPRQARIMVEDLLQNVEQDYQVHNRPSLPQLRSHLRHIRRFFTMDRALAVTTERLRDYIAHRQIEGAAPATINRELEHLRRGFTLAVEAHTLGTMPTFPSLPEHNARQVFFNRADFVKIVANLKVRERVDTDLQDFLAWFFQTGMRPKETASLTWAAFDKETWTLRLHAKDAKTRKGRVIALAGNTRAIIERRLKARRLDCPWVFHRSGKPVGDFRKVWNKACEAVGLVGGKQGYIAYDCRRTAVRNMVRAKVDPALAMKISGHRTRSLFDRYNIIDEEDLRDAMLKTDAYVDTLPATSALIPIHKEASG